MAEQDMDDALSVPFSSRCVAKLWRRVWAVICGKPCG
jgi:hypothetical protein